MFRASEGALRCGKEGDRCAAHSGLSSRLIVGHFCAHHFHKWWPPRSCNARMLKIVRRLNPDAAVPRYDLPEKPMGMHWSRHDRLVERYEGYNEHWGLAILHRL